MTRLRPNPHSPWPAFTSVLVAFRNKFKLDIPKFGTYPPWAGPVFGLRQSAECVIIWAFYSLFIGDRQFDPSEIEPRGLNNRKITESQSSLLFSKVYFLSQVQIPTSVL